MMLAAAIAYARLGWRVLPLFEAVAPGVCACTCGAVCQRVGKHPRLAQWQHLATSDEATIARWWAQWLTASIGIATGNGLLVVDRDGDEGEASWRELVGDQELPPTPISATGRGRHVLYSAHDARTTKGALGRGIDTRGDGGLVVVPPSPHASGRRYEWIVSPWNCELAPAPACVLDVLAAAPCAAPAGSGATPRRSSTRGSGVDLSDSGLDVVEAQRLLRDGASDIDIAAVLRARASFRKRATHAEDYLRRTISFARARHEQTLMRVAIARVYLDARPPIGDRPALAVLHLTLSRTGGTSLSVRASVVVPSARYDDASTRARYAAVAHDLDPRELARGNSMLARRLVGRELDIALREGRVAWIRNPNTKGQCR